MSQYPDEIYTPRVKENRSGITYDPEKKTVIFAEDLINLDEEVVAIENELGLNPKGSWGSVKERLEALGKGAIIFVIDGGGSVISTGEKGHLLIPFKCKIEEVSLLADQSGSIQIDIWKNTYNNFPPSDSDSICDGNEPAISDSDKYQDSELTNWTKTIDAGDILAFNVDSCSNITRVTIVLKVKKV